MIDIKSILESGSFYSFDVEGDGNQGQRPVEISFCHFDNGTLQKEHHFLINPGRKISQYATDIHGIRNSDVKDAPLFEEIAEEIRSIMTGAVLVGHDCMQDIQVIARQLPEAAILPKAILDSYKMAKRFDNEKKVSLKLSKIAERLGLTVNNAPDALVRKKFHSSSFDAWSTGVAARHYGSQIESDFNARKDANHRFAHHLPAATRLELEALAAARAPQTQF